MEKEFTITSLANYVKHEIEKADIDKWDLYLVESEVYGAYFYHSALEDTLKREFNTHTHNLDFFIRVFKQKSEDEMGIGFVQLNTPNERLIQSAIRRAKSISQVTSEMAYDLIKPGKHYADPKTYDDIVWNDPHEFLERKASYLQQRLQENVGITTTFGKFRTYKANKMLINNNGFQKLKKSTYFCYEFSLKAEKNGKKAEYWPMTFLKTVDQLKFDDYISEWAARARDLLDAKKTEAFSSIDVFLPASIIRKLFLSTVCHASKAKSLYEKTTPFRKGEKVASEKLTFMDDGLFKGGLNTSAWDSEGFPKRKTVVIDKGIMKNFLFDQRFASLMGKKSTGNAQRKVDEGGIMNIEFNNLVVQAGKRPLKKIVADSKQAIHVSDLAWVHANSITGRFIGEISQAYMINDGHLGRPIKGGYLTGNVYDMLFKIEEISAESRVIMNAKIPYIKFNNLRIVS